MELLRLRLIFLSLFLITVPVWGLVDPILDLNFFKNHSNCRTLRNYLYLNKDKMNLFKEKLGKNPDSAIFRRYELKCKNEEGSVYIMNGLVRSHYMTLLIHAVNKEVKDVKLVSFAEPTEYKPKVNWLQALNGRSFQKNIEIDGISGATLTTQTTKNLLNQVKIMENNFHDKK
ncbi:MAG: FMN-binding protein [Bacteriovoracaceae bacterium]|nr:FMN-binding protein [Bacteriovoracaceae bacterium]